MAQNVFILGAGASQEAGAPLMNDFLDKVDNLYTYEKDRLKLGRSFKSDLLLKDYENVRNIISDLQIIHSKSNLDLYNIETLFGAIEMANLISYLPNHNQDDISKLRSSIINVIVTTLELSVQFPVPSNYDDNDDDRGGDPFFILGVPKPYDELIKTLKLLPGDSAILTFNYDIAIDYAFFKSSWPINYHLDESNNDNKYSLLKLHGSINWGICPQCNKIIPMGFDDFIKSSRISNLNTDSPSNSFLISEGLKVFSHLNCKEAGFQRVDDVPVIVPPTWNKTQYHSSLANVWKHAARELSNAVNIFVIGYSLPETDSFFRYLYALGSIGSSPIKHFWVFDPDKSGTVNDRFRRMIGQGIERRYSYYKIGFSDAIKHIENNRNEL